jgi:hypothetical protein
MLILQNFKNDKQFATLIDEINQIKNLYDAVTITIQKGEPEAVEENGMLTIVQHDVSVVNITPEQLTSIIEKTESVRNKLISM